LNAIFTWVPCFDALQRISLKVAANSVFLSPVLTQISPDAMAHDLHASARDDTRIPPKKLSNSQISALLPLESPLR
jgi:hypothetical protein